MGYRPNKLRVSHFFRYIQRVFSFQQQVKRLNDHRVAPDVSTESHKRLYSYASCCDLGAFEP